MKRRQLRKGMEKVSALYIWLWESILMKLRIPPTEKYYSLKLTRLQKDRQILEFLKKAINSYPQNMIFHQKLAYIYMSKNKWSKANKHWSIILDSLKETTDPVSISQFGRSLRREGKLKDSKDVLDKGLSIYPDNPDVLFQRAEVSRRQEEWDKSIKFLRSAFNKYKGTPPVTYYLRLAYSYKKVCQYKKAGTILEKGLDKHPNHRRLLEEYSMMAILKKDWKEAKKRLEDSTSSFNGKDLLEERIKLAVVYQIIGNYDKARSLFTNAFESDKKKNIKKQPDDFLKLELFDNGESRIEFYKKYHETNTVVVTFDSINIQWDQQPFGFGFLLKENVDIIAVRRRSPSSYQQDLSLEDFYEAVNVLVAYYENKIAYGFSLGAYSALYFGSTINCRILSLSPRNSAHPMHEGKLVEDQPFHHQLSHDINPNISPIIAYDPKNTVDREYIDEELKKSYPNGVYLEFPYAGHRIAPFFLQVGILKDVVQRVISDKEIPKYNNIPRNKSHQYLRVLGNACLRRNKSNWALRLGKRATSISPKDVPANILKIRALMYLGENTEALDVAEKANELIVNNKRIRLFLIGLYIQSNDMGKAKKLAKRSLEDFNEFEEFEEVAKNLQEL